MTICTSSFAPAAIFKNESFDLKLTQAIVIVEEEGKGFLSEVFMSYYTEYPTTKTLRNIN